MILKNPNRKAILVNGPPASGKTTIAEGLAQYFHLPILARDAVQEALYDVIGTGDREYNRMLGRAGMAVIWSMLRHFPPDATVIIDAWCRYPPFDWLVEGFKTAGITHFVEVFCWAPGEILAKRYLSRVGQRHTGHPGKEFAAELIEVAKKAKPTGLCEMYFVDTYSQKEADINQIAEWTAHKLIISPKRP
jgi:glucokinase